ncbi:MAG: RNA polymerase sigma factor [Phycisphaerales bacterium]|nr:RNA polymerase sigma factor [Phycisphaerales bacterium]
MNQAAGKPRSLNQSSSVLDATEFARLIEDHYADLEVIAAAHAGRSAAQDVLHDASIVAMRVLHEFTPGTSFRAWMAAIIRNVASNEQRKQRRHRWRLERLWQSAPSPEPPPSRGPSVPELDAALARLSDDQRCCILLKVVLARSYAEIAECLGIPEPTARSHVFRARKRMLELLPPSIGGAT